MDERGRRRDKLKTRINMVDSGKEENGMVYNGRKWKMGKNGNVKVEKWKWKKTEMKKMENGR